MRKISLLCLFFLIGFVTLALEAVAAGAGTSAAPASEPFPVALTPEQARQALDVLNDPKRRAQMEDTLRAVAAAGELSAPGAATSAAPAVSPASAPTGGRPGALQANGLASQMSRQAVSDFHAVTGALGNSMSALLDTASVRTWWTEQMMNPQRVALLLHLAWVVLATLVPAGLCAGLTHALFRKRLRALVGRQLEIEEQRSGELSGADAAQADARDAKTTPADATDPGSAVAPDVGSPAQLSLAMRRARNTAQALGHWTLLQQLPIALLRTTLKAVPLMVFIVVAILLMSALTDDGSPAARVVGTLIQIFAICRAIALAGDFLLAPDRPRLRLLRLSDPRAAFLMRWVVRLVTVLGVGAGVAAAPLPIGLTAEAHLALVKVVSLIGHVMVAILILQCRRPVARWIRASSKQSDSLRIVGDWLADIWAGLTVFFVVALWFVWALDVQDGYRVLLHRGGISVLVLIGARITALVAFGVLGRIFKVDEGETGSIAYQHAYRYYPLLRRLTWWAIALTTLSIVLSVWGVHVWSAVLSGSIGARLASAVTTIAVATIVALLIWEAINIAIEHKLDRWVAEGDFVRAARLRTLLPMLRATLFIVIAVVVVLTGLSELGVNTGPLLASASIFGVALGFGSQKLVQDFITGIFLLMENTMQVGDWVTLAGVSGTVEYLSIRTVRLRGGDGSLFTVPFSSVSTVNNTNRGIGNAAVSVSIVYGQDIDLAVATLKEIGAALREDDRFKDGILSDFAYWGVDKVDGSMVTMSGQVQCRDSMRWAVQREFNLQIARRFKERGIEIANPQRSVLIDEGGRAHAQSPAQSPDAAAKPAAIKQVQGRSRDA